jgi:hypothetical protein
MLFAAHAIGATVFGAMLDNTGDSYRLRSSRHRARRLAAVGIALHGK